MAYLMTHFWPGAKESADRFLNDVLMPSMPVEGGFTGYPEERVAEVANLQTA